MTDVVGTKLDAELEADDLIARLPEVASGEWTVLDCRRGPVRKQRRKRIVLFDLDVYVGDRLDIERRTILAKFYGARRGPEGFLALRAMEAAGFKTPSVDRVPRAHAYDQRRAILFQEFVPGPTWADGLDAEGDIAGWSERVARWVVKLQRTAVDLPAPTALDHHDIRVHARALTDHLGRDDLDGAVEEICRRRAIDATSVVAAHRDLHPKNVVISGSDVVVIDFDHAAEAGPAVDVGYAMGQLLVMSFMRTGSFTRGAAGAAAFWTTYRDLGGDAPWECVAGEVARTFVQSLHFELCTLKNGRVELAPIWFEQVRRWLDSDGPASAGLV